MFERPLALLLCLGVATALAPIRPHASTATARPAVPATQTDVRALRFEENRGQTDRRVDFMSRGPGYTLFLTPGSAVFAIAEPRTRGADRDCGERPVTGEDVVRFVFEGSNPGARLTGTGVLPGRASYFVGDDASAWRRDVPSFERVQASGVYPGVDVVYYGGVDGALEYDFVVAPNADPARIRLRVDGAGATRIEDGDLVVSTRFGELRQRRPSLSQTVGTTRRGVPGAFERNGDGTIGFRVGVYDRSLPLVIDPVLSYSTLLGGSSADAAESTDVDATGAIYLIGETRGTDFPSAVDLPETVHGEVDLFVAKLNPAGTAVVYAVYVGGSGDEISASIRVDDDGNAVGRGFTFSTDFPTVNAAQPQFGGDRDGVVFKINAGGTGFVFSTFLGGSGFEDCYTGLAVDAAGSVYVSGCTTSADFPVLNAYDNTMDGLQDGYVAKYRANGQPSGAIRAAKTSLVPPPYVDWNASRT